MPASERSKEIVMDRDHLLAAELFSYSFANYSNHLGIGHERFEKLMPQDAKLLERAEMCGSQKNYK